MACRLSGARFVGKAYPQSHQSHPLKLYMSIQQPLAVQIQINSHTMRNLESLDKKTTFTAEVVDVDAIKIAFADYLNRLPAFTILKVTFEIVEN